ncbi:MAG: phosphatase PAP2 family protein [Muribaculaceae bacterium]|nr:phosphatase PAP2 family protein [Muribaculaceae bacterium]MBQ3910602.1 phosphatase PAP2 family protein [Muribaculaceae bacterium]MBQ6648281.1 phosphatase PAP2 family protein [Muribaculaceae bacterium]
MDALQQFDAGIFSAINGWHAAYFDSFMWLVTKIATWIPMILMLLYLLYFKKGWRKTVAVVLAIALVILIADQVSASIIKPLVERARPSHNESLQSTIHIVNGYRGGPFGFVSSHAANCFGIALLLAMIFKNRLFTWTMVVWATLMCYSRIYLGVHYPGDIVCGAILGFLAAWLVYRIFVWFGKKHPEWGSVSFSYNESRQLIYAAVINITILAVWAVFITTT